MTERGHQTKLNECTSTQTAKELRTNNLGRASQYMRLQAEALQGISGNAVCDRHPPVIL
jgi:hypothetical protein